MKIIRGFKKRQYESYRVAAYVVSEMAQIMLKNAKPFQMNRRMPPYDELDLTDAQKKKLDTYRAKKRIRDRVNRGKS